MDWIIPFVAIFGAVGVLWALRGYFTEPTIIDERDPTGPEKDATRTKDKFRN